MASIEAAIGRPFTGYYRSIQAKATALTESLTKNHGFIDGNKRTTFLVVDLFLHRSGYRLHGRVHSGFRELEDLIVAVADGTVSAGGVLQWYKDRVRRR